MQPLRGNTALEVRRIRTVEAAKVRRLRTRLAAAAEFSRARVHGFARTRRLATTDYQLLRNAVADYVLGQEHVGSLKELMTKLAEQLVADDVEFAQGPRQGVELGLLLEASALFTGSTMAAVEASPHRDELLKLLNSMDDPDEFALGVEAQCVVECSQDDVMAGARAVLNEACADDDMDEALASRTADGYGASLVTTTAAEEFTYTAVNKCWVREYTVDLDTGEELDEQVRRLDSGDGDLCAFAEGYLNEDLGFLSQVAAEQTPLTGIKSISVDGEECAWTLTADHELTEAEKAEVADWVQGQCSDGIGEGLEQQETDCSDRDREEVEYEDPETGEVERDVHTVETRYYVMMWNFDDDNDVEVY